MLQFGVAKELGMSLREVRATMTAEASTRVGVPTSLCSSRASARTMRSASGSAKSMARSADVSMTT